MPVHKTVLQVEVLTEDGDVSDMDLADIAREIFEGDASGKVTTISSRELSDSEARTAAYAQGSDPEFFNCLNRNDDFSDDPVGGDNASGTFSFPLYLNGHASTEHGTPPAYARIDVTEELLLKVEQLKNLCSLHGLARVVVDARPAAWADDAEALRLDSPALVVAGDDFWFQDRPKHGGHEIETTSFSLSHLTGMFQSRAKTGDASPHYEDETVKEAVEGIDGDDDGTTAPRDR